MCKCKQRFYTISHRNMYVICTHSRTKNSSWFVIKTSGGQQKHYDCTITYYDCMCKGTAEYKTNWFFYFLQFSLETKRERERKFYRIREVCGFSQNVKIIRTCPLLVLSKFKAKKTIIQKLWIEKYKLNKI